MFPLLHRRDEETCPSSPARSNQPAASTKAEAWLGSVTSLSKTLRIMRNTALKLNKPITMYCFTEISPIERSPTTTLTHRTTNTGSSTALIAFATCSASGHTAAASSVLDESSSVVPLPKRMEAWPGSVTSSWKTSKSLHGGATENDWSGIVETRKGDD